jgi:hypothetical protein
MDHTHGAGENAAAARYRRCFGHSIPDRLLQVIPGVDVIVVDNARPEP